MMTQDEARALVAAVRKLDELQRSVLRLLKADLEAEAERQSGQLEDISKALPLGMAIEFIKGGNFVEAIRDIEDAYRI